MMQRVIPDAASHYHDMGANVNAVAGKEVLHKWTAFQREPQTADQVRALPWRKATGVGIINGVNGWRTFDLDKCPSDEPMRRMVAALGLPVDYDWKGPSGSGKGWRITVRCFDDLPAGLLTTNGEAGVFWGLPKEGMSFDHIELRWERCQTIHPPSAHPDPGTPGYQWPGAEPTEPPAVVSLGHILSAFFAVATPKRTEPKPVTPPKPKREPSTAEPSDLGNAIAEVKQRFDLVAYAQQHWPGEARIERNGETRILGHGGLLINVEKGVWTRFEAETGGDALDLVGYKIYGDSWDRDNGTKFITALKEAADYTNVTLPPPPANPLAELTKHGIPLLSGAEGDEITRLRLEVIYQRETIALQQYIITQLRVALDELRERNQFVSVAAGANIAGAGKRLTLIELKKEIDTAPGDDRQDGAWTRVRSSYMGACTKQDAGTISRHLKIFEDEGWIERDIRRVRDPEQPPEKQWTSATFVRALVDLGDPSQAVLLPKPRGVHACRKCGSVKLEHHGYNKCTCCGHIQDVTKDWANSQAVRDQEDTPKAELQTAIQAEDAATFFEELPEPLTGKLPDKENVATVSSSELQIAIQPEVEPDFDQPRGLRILAEHARYVSDERGGIAYKQAIMFLHYGEPGKALDLVPSIHDETARANVIYAANRVSAVVEQATPSFFGPGNPDIRGWEIKGQYFPRTMIDAIIAEEAAS